MAQACRLPLLVTSDYNRATKPSPVELFVNDDSLFPFPLANVQMMDAALAAIDAHLLGAFAAEDAYHGIDHAHEVEADCRRIAAAPEIALSDSELFVLRAAALLHDVGYADHAPDWSQDRREHIQASLARAAALLPTLPVFRKQPALLQAALYLIAFHDDTNYKFPSLAHDGVVMPVALGPFAAPIAAYEASLSPTALIRLRLMLNILREADATAATDTRGAERTFRYSVSRGVPVFAPGDPLNAWAWEESAVGNVRVAARRLLIDAVSHAGQQQARTAYAAAEAFVEDVCTQHGVPYVPESGPADPAVVGSLAEPLAEQEFRIVRYLGWEAVEALLHDVRLNGDHTLKPYADAQIRARRLRIADLRPTAYYALQGQLEGHRFLQRSLEREYALSLFDLSGALDYYAGDTLYRMGPPLIETYFEPDEGQVVSVIVDGLHRILLAKSLGLEFIWAVEITGIPPQFPLVPLPLRWQDIRLMDAVPPLEAKRRFRFPTLADFPDISGYSQVKVDESSYRYFFYRDLSPLGSPGIRQWPTLGNTRS